MLNWVWGENGQCLEATVPNGKFTIIHKMVGDMHYFQILFNSKEIFQTKKIGRAKELCEEYLQEKAK